MLKKDLESRLIELGVIKTDLKWIKEGVQNIDKHLKELNGSVGKIKIKTNTHEIRLGNIEEDLDGDEEQKDKAKWFKRDHIYAIIGSTITGLLFIAISYLV